MFFSSFFFHIFKSSIEDCVDSLKTENLKNSIIFIINYKGIDIIYTVIQTVLTLYPELYFQFGNNLLLLFFYLLTKHQNYLKLNQ